MFFADCVEGLSPATSAGIGLFPGRVQMLKERLRPKTKELRWPKDPYCLADPLTWVISILKGKVLPDCFKIMTMRCNYFLNFNITLFVYVCVSLQGSTPRSCTGIENGRRSDLLF